MLWWYNISAPLQFALLFVVYFGLAWLINIVTFAPRFVPFFRSLIGVVAPFFTAVALLFGLLAGFLANDVSARYRQAADAVVAEANSMIALHALTVAAPGDATAAINAALHDFLASVLKDEWPRMTERGGAPEADRAYRALLERIAAPATAASIGPTLQSNLLMTAQRIGTARSARLSMMFDRSNEVKWATVLILALLTQVAIALVHLDKRRPQAAALAVFTAAVVASLWLIVLQETPFEGVMRVMPTPLAGVLTVIGAPP